MISLPANDPRRLALESNSLEVSALLEFGFSPALRFTDAPYDIEDDGRLYGATNSIFNVELPKVGAGGLRNPLGLQFAGKPDENLDDWSRIWRRNQYGIPLRIKIVFKDADGGYTSS